MYVQPYSSSSEEGMVTVFCDSTRRQTALEDRVTHPVAADCRGLLA